MSQLKTKNYKKQLSVFAVLIILIVLILILILVILILVVLVLILVLILVVHGTTSKSFSRDYRIGRMPRKSGFILGFKNQADNETGKDCYGDAAGAGF